jgi:hypothetical protein
VRRPALTTDQRRRSSLITVESTRGRGDRESLSSDQVPESDGLAVHQTASHIYDGDLPVRSAGADERFAQPVKRATATMGRGGRVAL